MQQHIFRSRAKLTNFEIAPLPPRLTVPQERLVNYGSEALDTVEHLGLILKDHKKAAALLQHFGSIDYTTFDNIY
ncbi:MAG: hypothetical protein JO333_16050 [Verrucomicrobia bacterium]|nr:hypothetical protein [Verrucomicrobiota bacterium]